MVAERETMTSSVLVLMRIGEDQRAKVSERERLLDPTIHSYGVANVGKDPTGHDLEPHSQSISGMTPPAALPPAYMLLSARFQ